ncbi:MAG: protein kinase [Fimbriimonadaceae bacterium]|nr:protein kinase [Fimbriimonadaceae bacterium]
MSVLSSMSNRPQFVLHVADGPQRGAQIPLREGDVVVGRNPNCGITLAHNQVAPTHCGLRVRQDQVIVAPGGTIVPTTVNGERLQKATLLRVGDVLGIGPYRLLLRMREEPDVYNHAVGDRVGPYTILSELGAGAVGRVYEAQGNGRTVALKLLRLRPGMTPREEEHRRALFRREAQALAGIEHPNVVRSFGSGEHDGLPWLAMEFLQGPTLREVMVGGRLPVTAIERILFQLCSAVAAVHDAEIIHRDLKPANVMLVGSEPRVVLADFGLAQPRGGPRLEEIDPPDFSTNVRIGKQIGTPAYMPPEQTQGQEADTRSDVWSLGAMAYELISGRRPFPGNDVRTVLTAVCHGCPDPLPADIAPHLVGAVYKCLQKRPAYRFPTARQMVEAIHDRRMVQLLPVGVEGPPQQVLTGCPHCNAPISHPLTCSECYKPIYRYTDGQVYALPQDRDVQLCCAHCGSTVAVHDATCPTCGMVFSDLPPVGLARTSKNLGARGSIVVDIFDQAMALLSKCPYCNAERVDDRACCGGCGFSFRAYVASRVKLEMVTGGWATSCASCGAAVPTPDEPHCPGCGLNFASGIYPDGTRFPDSVPRYLQRRLDAQR